ncbi:MAG: lytic transglycosylase domain-containing protein [Pseudomonadota bacterium]
MVAHYDGRGSERSQSVPAVLSGDEQSYYNTLFAAIDRQQWEQVEALLEESEGGLLDQIARAEYYTHANSPKVSAEQISRWFDNGVHLPQAQQLGRMGAKRGLERLPSFPRAQNMRAQPYASKRIRPRTITDGSLPGNVRSDILDSIKNDDPAGAHALLIEIDEQLSPEARAEWRQRVAWSYYIENDDAAALALAETVSEGSGAWVAEGNWVAGLAAWRQGLCAIAAEAFGRSADSSTNVELTAAAHYWAHRSLMRCRAPGQAQQHLNAAARYDETLYGLLANEQLGVRPPADAQAAPFTENDWRTLSRNPNVRIAAALTEIGRPALADEVLRHQARIGSSSDYAGLARLARELGLPSTQLFMAHNAPRGMRSDRSLRYPVARWQPTTGWRVDPALAFAHALQESNFRAGAVSPANARGLMQIMPGTARDHNRRLNLGASYADLNNPEVNLAYGQRHLEMLRDSPVTQGKLPKIMAAYNAGLTPISRWNSEIRDFDDPLLYMESIPYWETRGYVAIVMRNYWMYERAAGVSSPSRRALAEGRWPEFPQMSIRRSAQLER